MSATCSSSLVDRLRGIYTMDVNDGAGPLNGKDTFTRKFEGLPPINEEAAKRIEELEAATAQLAVFEVGEHDYFIASSAEEALADIESHTGADHLTIEDVRQLTIDDMRGLTYYEDIYDRTGARSFLEQVGRLVLDNEWEPGIFATSDI